MLVGNCQVVSCAALLRAAGFTDVTAHRFSQINPEDLSPDRVKQYDLIVAHETIRNRPTFVAALADKPNLITIPPLFFNGFTPDDELGGVTFGNGTVIELSRIAVGAFRHSLSRDEAVALYSPEFCDLMGYPQALERARNNLIRTLAPYIPEIEQLYAKWYAQGPFFYTGNHPKLFVVEDMFRNVLKRKAGIVLQENLSSFCPDPLQDYAASPQMNHPNVRNALTNPNHLRKLGSKLVSCADFVDFCYTRLSKLGDTVTYSDASNAQFDSALLRWRDRPPLEKAENPYRSQPARAFWKQAVARPASHEVRPIGDATAIIWPEARVATAGSCFAQHVARAMVADGLDYYVSEKAPSGMPEDIATARGYGLFSARFGNIYSSRQLLQLIKRAYGEFVPFDTAWPVKDGFVDPFRPNFGQVFESPEAVEAERATHMACVREMFENLDVFVFTMGLTEGWVDRRDGAAFPVAPGAVSDQIDPKHYEFVNSGYTAVSAEMTEFLVRLGRVNKNARVVLTVSPVPLIATYSDTDALTATTYSKSVLRSVAGDLAQNFPNVFYFPSYEIITGSFNRGAYYEADLRSIRPEGVAHVMEVFRAVLVGRTEQIRIEEDSPRFGVDAEYQRQLDVVCDEEMLVR
ncbi:GSCFA domain-containing protein [Pararhodobacter zhoushanensis]|uniref:GSCFA domain-containing protein n=1 Tax=Pararhodobacter zhoushanensis TaxID=2479545 RepID=UPI0013DEEC42|nr:GSCFA domain-containing protein [Pararhodobacter zhoushanensis]